MANTLRDEAKAYEPKQTKNIAELELVAVDTEVVEKEYTKKDGETFTVQEITVEGVAYRVPTSVIASLKMQLEENPDAEYFKAKSSGEGLNTQYTVVLK